MSENKDIRLSNNNHFLLSRISEIENTTINDIVNDKIKEYVSEKLQDIHWVPKNDKFEDTVYKYFISYDEEDISSEEVKKSLDFLKSKGYDIKNLEKQTKQIILKKINLPYRIKIKKIIEEDNKIYFILDSLKNQKIDSEEFFNIFEKAEPINPDKFFEENRKELIKLLEP